MYSQMFALQSQLFKSLAHPSRLEIIHLLRDQELPVTDIHTMLDLPQATISQHLMVLREAGIVSAHREGKQVYYKISDSNIIKASDLLRQVLVRQHADSALANALALKMKELVPVVQDPVCHMRLSPKTAGYHLTHNSSDFYFCASGCLVQFQKDPEKYA